MTIWLGVREERDGVMKQYSDLARSLRRTSLKRIAPQWTSFRNSIVADRIGGCPEADKAPIGDAPGLAVADSDSWPVSGFGEQVI
jgi:hypothetical protein